MYVGFRTTELVLDRAVTATPATGAGQPLVTTVKRGAVRVRLKTRRVPAAAETAAIVATVPQRKTVLSTSSKRNESMATRTTVLPTMATA